MGIFTFDPSDPAQRRLDPALGKYLFELYVDPSWILRRIEAFSLADLRTAHWQVTVDIDVPVLKARSASLSVLKQGSQCCLAPIAIVQKDLLINFDVRDESSAAVPLPTRHDDSHAAYCLLSHAAREVLKRRIHVDVAERLFDVAFEFPGLSSADATTPPTPLRLPVPGWSQQAQSQWQDLVQSPSFEPLLNVFSQGFLLLTLVPADSGTKIVKFAYETPLRSLPWTYLQKLGIRSAAVIAEVPALGNARSHHISFSAPPGLVFIDARLHRVALGPAPVERLYQRKVNRTHAHLYTSGFPRTDSSSVVSTFKLRVPYPGFLRTALISLTFITVVLLLVVRYDERLITLTEKQADAAVTLLVIIPSVVAAFAVRPREHDMVTRVLRWLRAGIGVAAVFPYAAAAILFVRPGTLAWQRAVLWALFGLAALQVLVLVFVRWVTKRDVRAVADSEGVVQHEQLEPAPQEILAQLAAGVDPG